MPYYQPKFYAITTSDLICAPDYLAKIERVLPNIALFQYRHKGQHDLQQIKAMQLLCQQYHVPFIINDDIQLASTLKADGVHLGQQDGSLSNARTILGKKAILGITCHDSIELAKQAEKNGADYVSFGCFFHSTTKPNAKSAALDVLTHAKTQLACAIVAIGGINKDNLYQVLKHQPDYVALGQSIPVILESA